jgi:hypothetical protein
MPMLKVRPFDSDNISWFRAQLYEVGRAIDHSLQSNQVDGHDAAALKVVANDIVKSGVVRKARGETIIDKVTNGLKVSTLHNIFGNDQRTIDKNVHLKAALIGLFSGYESFDAALMARGEPQTDQFLRDAAHEIEALDFICVTIDKPYSYLAMTEDHFRQKAEIYRDFENNEIGHFYEWQKVEDPFAAESLDTSPSEPSMA